MSCEDEEEKKKLDSSSREATNVRSDEDETNQLTNDSLIHNSYNLYIRGKGKKR